MTVLVGGLRVLGANYDGSHARRASPRRPGALTNDFFVNLLDLGTDVDSRPADDASTFEGRDAARRASSGPAAGSTSSSARTPSCAPLAEVYASDDAKEKFVHDFVAAWDKVMNLDRFDVR